MAAYSRKQWVIIVVFCIAQFCNAICVSLQAPFYPAEAEAKGATATQYGLVFGVFELTVFLISPVYGKYLERIGIRFVNNCGIFTVSVMCILFGFLDKIDDTSAFIGFSFAIRIVEALGNAAFITSAFSIIAKEFPNNVGGAFATQETFFGLGLIAGPTVGGALYEVGGYTLPFVCMGGLLMAASVVVHFALPIRQESNGKSAPASGSILASLKIGCIAISAFATMATAISIGFLMATLEPHLRPLDLKPFQMGIMFILNGGTYALCAPIWGWLIDHKMHPRVAILIGAILVIVAFLFIGPAPFMPIELSLPLAVGSLLIHGVGIGAELVATFGGSHRDSLKMGYPDDLSTYCMISGLWTSSFALGCFIGPSVSGILFDLIGFDWATVTVAALHFLVAILVFLYLCISDARRQRKRPFFYLSANHDLCPSEVTSIKGSEDSNYGTCQSHI